jgi:hypothetical protein
VVAVATFPWSVFTIGDVRVTVIQKFKKQAKKKTPTDLDRALFECGPTSPDSTLFLGFS